MSENQTQIVMLNPNEIQRGSNIRFSLKKSRVDRLMASIMEPNPSTNECTGVQDPITVSALPEPEAGFKYLLTTGNYRHEAVTRLNKEQKAGLLVPAIIRPVADQADRIAQQLLENTERENMSPIDTAIAITALREAGKANVEICKMFPRPTGKGGKLESASNAWVNMTADFLKLPKTIQTKIHEGVIGVKAAYELGKAPADKQEAIITRAENDRAKELKAEEESEKKIADALARDAKKNKKLNELKASNEKLKSDVDEAKKKVAEAKDAVKAAYDATLSHIEAKTKAEAQKIKEKRKEAHQAAATKLKETEKAAEKAENEHAKVVVRLTKVEENAKLLKVKLEKKQKEAQAKKPLSQKDVQKAAKKEGVANAPVPLNAKDMRDVVNEMALPSSQPKMREIGIALRDCFAGIGTNSDLFRKIAKVTGEKYGKQREG